MKQNPTIPTMWKRLLLTEQALIAKHGLEKYKAETVFVIMQMPKKNCKLCFGRGYRDREASVGRIVPCACTKGFGLRGIADLKDDEIVMDFDGAIYIAEGERDV